MSWSIVFPMNNWHMESTTFRDSLLWCKCKYFLSLELRNSLVTFNLFIIIIIIIIIIIYFYY